MDHVIDVGEQWGAALAAFLDRRDQRLMHVTVDLDTRDGVIRTLERCCRERTSGHTVLVVRSAANGAIGWDLRTVELITQYGSIRRALARLGKAELPAVPAALLPDPIGSAGLPRFAEALGHVSAGLGVLGGDLVIALAPCAGVDADRAWSDDVARLAESISRAPRNRLIVVETGAPPSRSALEGMGAALARVVLDPQVVRRQILDRMRAQAAAPTGATGPRALGGAGPPIAPPPRPRATPVRPLDAAAAAALSPDARLAIDRPASDAIRRATARALSSIADGEHDAALASQREVVAIAARAGADGATADALLLLGTLSMIARRDADAREALERAVAVGRRAGNDVVACQALFALAGVEMLADRHTAAAATYRRAAEVARNARSLVLAIDGLRACGESLVRAGRSAEAVAVWRDAVELARASQSPEVAVSAAPDLARRLASTCDGHGLVNEARELRDMALAFETERRDG